MAVIIYTEGGSQHAIVPDVTITEAHSESTETPEHPVESGPAKLDHVRPKPSSIRLEWLVTDSPLPSSGRSIAPDSIASQTTSGDLSPSDGRAFRIYQELDYVRRNGIVCTVETGLRRYSTMVISDLATTRDKTLRKALKIQLTLKEVSIVTTATVNIALPKTRKGQPRTTNGAAAGKEVKDETKKTLLRKLVAGLGG